MPEQTTSVDTGLTGDAGLAAAAGLGTWRLVDAVDTPPAGAGERAERVPWDRLPGEKALWYQRFIVYRSLGATRTVASAYRASVVLEAATNGRLKGSYLGKPDNSWYAYAAKYNWDERAAAWDQALRSRMDRVEEQRRVERREQRRHNIDELMAYVMVAFRKADLPNLSTAEARRLLGVLRVLIHDLLVADRLEMGEPTSIEEVAERLLTADDLAAAERQIADYLDSVQAGWKGVRADADGE